MTIVNNMLDVAQKAVNNNETLFWKQTGTMIQILPQGIPENEEAKLYINVSTMFAPPI